MVMRPALTLTYLLSLCLALGAFSIESAIAAEFNYVHAVYSLKRDGQPIGRVIETFEREGARYRIVSEAKAEGIAALFVKGPLRMVSEGEVDANGLKPLKFERLRNNKAISARFNWNDGQLISTEGETTITETLAAKTQDRLSAMYQFMLVPPKRERIEMPMTNGKKPTDYSFNRGERARITTRAGAFDTIKVTREQSTDRSDSNANDSVELWLAVKRKYLPVRLKIREDGTLYEQELVKLETR